RDLLQVLQPMGFETLYFEEMTTKEQALAMIESETIVAPHGSGIANLIWTLADAQPRQRNLIEICSRNRYNFGLFPTLSDACSVRHQTVITRNVGFRKNFKVNPDDIRFALQRAAATHGSNRKAA
ncbi:MAG: glycosyltransferase family 61 protein, partial [Planctomycetota bacterium]